MNPIKLEIFLDDKTLAGMKSVEGNIAAMESVTRQVIENLKLQLKDLEKQYKVLQGQGLAGDKELADIQAMQSAIGGLKDQLKELQRAKQQTNEMPIIDERAVIKQTNTLKMQFSQVARELPSLAMGPQMFILAISNNLPYLADAIKDVRVQNEALSKSGQKATPVWKQLLSAAGSWQTMLVVGITLLTVYGKEIWEWTKGLFKAKDATLDLLTAEQEMAQARSKVSDSIKKERAELDILYAKLKTTAVSTKERTAAVNEWLKRYPEYANILNGENVNLSKLESAYKALSKEIYANAVARSYADKIADLSVKKEKEEIKRLNQKLTVAKAQQEYERKIEEYNSKKERGFGSATAKLDAEAGVEKARRNVADQQKIYDDLINNVKSYDSHITTIENHIKTLDLFPQPEEGTFDYWTQQKDRAEGVLKEIKSSVKKTLDDASKEGKDLFSLGLDKTVVETYVSATKDLKKAKKELEVYDEKDKKGKGGKTTTDYQNELADARVRAQQKLEEARIAVMNDGYLKRKELANKEYKETIAAIDKQERDDLERMAKAKKNGVKVTPDQEKEVKDTAAIHRAIAHDKYFKDYAAIQTDWMSQNTKAWIAYNKEFGTHQQKRLAIAQEYAIKIAQAENPVDKERLKKEMEENIQAMDFSKLKKDMNWESIFGNLSALTKKQLLDVKRQLVTFRNSPEFKQQSSPEQIKIIEDALNNINTALVDKGGLFGGLTDSMLEYKEAVDNVKKAQEALNKAIEKGDKAAIDKANTDLVNAKNKENNAGLNVEKSKDKAISNITAVANAMKQLGSAEFSLTSFGTVVGGLVDALSSSGSKIGGIIAAILSLLDEFGKDGGVEFGKNVVNNIVSAIGGTMEVPFKMLGIDMGLGGADYSGYNQMVEQYDHLNEIWDELIDKKKEYIKTSYGDEAYQAGKEAEELVNKSIESYRTLGKERLNAGASAGSHSIGVRIRKGMSKEGWNEAKKALGGDFDKYNIGDGRMTGLFDLSIEQLDKLKTEAPTFWAKLDGDVLDYLNNIIEGAERLEEIQLQVKEQLTQVSFDSLRDSFLDTLLDMDASAEDFANDFTKYMQRAIMNTMLAKTYESRLQAWYDSFAEANRLNEGGKSNINDDEYKKLQDEWNKIVSDALGDRDALKDIFDWKGEEETSSQSGRSGAFVTMSQEQGTKLEGLFTSLQDHASGMHQLLEDLKQGRDADHELFVQIAENTAYCKFLELMYEIMERQDRDGLKLKG